MTVKTAGSSSYFRGSGGPSQVYTSIVSNLQKGRGKGLQIACNIVYVLNGRPLGRRLMV